MRHAVRPAAPRPYEMCGPPVSSCESGGPPASQEHHQPHTNIDYGEERAKGLQRILESGL